MYRFSLGFGSLCAIFADGEDKDGETVLGLEGEGGRMDAAMPGQRSRIAGAN